MSAGVKFRRGAISKNATNSSTKEPNATKWTSSKSFSDVQPKNHVGLKQITPI